MLSSFTASTMNPDNLLRDTATSKNLETMMTFDVEEPENIGSMHEMTKAQANRILLKTDLVVMPLIVLAMTLAFLDKNALGYAAVFGLRKDANLEGQDYSWLGSIFYFGYLAMEFPNIWLITKVPIGKYIGVCLFLWGVTLCLMAVCHNFAGLATIRFFLGVFEAAVLPCMILVNSIWYRREEQPLRTAFWYNTFAGVFGGILSYAIGKIGGALSTWKYIFLIYGATTILLGVLIFFGLPDSPSKAWFLNGKEKRMAVVRLTYDQTGVDTQKSFKPSQVMETFRDPNAYCIWACAFGYAITNAGITNFNPLIISGYGFSETKTVLMATPQAAIAMIAAAVLSAVSFKVQNMRCVFWVSSSIIGLVGAVMVHVLNTETQRTASLVGVYLMGFYNVPWIFMLSLSSSNVAGITKKSFMGVTIAVIYAIGNIIGPQFFLQEQAPHYPLGIGAMLCAFAIMAVSGVLHLIYCMYENRRRDRVHGKVDNHQLPFPDLGSSDDTDMENNNFRYTY